MTNAQDAKILDKVRKLLALAASPQEEEARTAALLASRLILEHGIQLTLGGQTVVRGAEPCGAPVRPTNLTAPRRMQSKFPGWCRACHAPFDVGADILWLKDVGAAHVACGWAP
jgi:hypothetical protein